MQDSSGKRGDGSADFDPQGASARPGGEAAGGVSPHPDDPAGPAAADPAGGAARRAMRDAGFGDHKGGDIS